MWLKSCKNDLISRNYDFLSRKYDFLNLIITTFKSRNNDFLSRNNDFLSRNYDFLSRNYDFLFFFKFHFFDPSRLSYFRTSNMKKKFKYHCQTFNLIK